MTRLSTPARLAASLTRFCGLPPPCEHIWTDGTWGRGARMVCQVSYDLRLSGLPGVALFFPGSDAVIDSQMALAVETFKSQW